MTVDCSFPLLFHRSMVYACSQEVVLQKRCHFPRMPSAALMLFYCSFALILLFLLLYILLLLSLELDVAAIDSAVLKSCLAVFATLAFVIVNMCTPFLEYCCMLVRPNVDLRCGLSSICYLLILLQILLSHSHSLDCDNETTWWTSTHIPWRS